MAYEFFFGPGPVLDPSTGLPIPNATLQVYLEQEGGDPLTVKVGDVEVLTVQSGVSGMLQQFAASYMSVYVEGAGIPRFRVDSFDGMRQYVEAQAQAAADASNTMAEALTRTFQAVETSGGTILNAPGVTPFATKSAAEAAIADTAGVISGAIALVLDPDA